MKRTLFSCMALALGFTSFAQAELESAVMLDWAEDTTQVTTIADIISVQEKVTSSNSTLRHFSKVWGRNTYFNISYANASLNPKEPILLGYNYNNNTVPDFKSDWGASITIGHNYRLHKKPIANIVQFNIDYTYIDLDINHFKIEPGEYLYDSNNLKPSDDNYRDNFYMPWCLEKYEANYSMSIGPSITIAPFTYVKVPQLQFVKLNVYYHIGYQASILWMLNDKEKDANPDKVSNNGWQETKFDKMNGALKMNWGHGLTSSFGFSVSWKTIGIGYEIRSSKVEYQPFQTDIFGKEKYKFNSSLSRVFIQFRY